MKHIFYLSAVTILVACSTQEDEKPKLDTSVPVKDSVVPPVERESAYTTKTEVKTEHIKASDQENKLMDLIWNLKEVQDLNAEIESKSKGKRHLASLITSKPSDDREYYGISVSEDNGEAFATYFEFHVYPNDEIFYYDPIEDQEISLAAWRKSKK